MPRITSPFARSFSYTILANLTVAAVGILSVAVIPAYLGVAGYGYWQLFVFYSSYSLIVQAGLADGAYLRYGGMKTADLRQRSVLSQMLLMNCLVIPFAAALAATAGIVDLPFERKYVLWLLSIHVVIANTRHFAVLLLQATGQFRIFSLATIADRFLYLGLVLILLMFGVQDFRWFIAVELFAKVASLSLLLRPAAQYRQAGVIPSTVVTLRELARNVASGIQMTISNTSNMLILGVNRLLADATWGVATFGRLALALNISSLFMLFINSMGLVFFPFLRRSKRELMAELYISLRLPLTVLMFALLCTAWPLRQFGPVWLPAFADSFSVVIILLPILIFESRMGLLINPIMKTLRYETLLLAVNVGAIALGATLGAMASLILNDLHFMAAGITLTLILRGSVAEAILASRLHLSIMRERVSEYVILSMYYVSLFLWEGWEGFLLFGGLAFIVLTISWRTLGSKVAHARLLLSSLS